MKYQPKSDFEKRTLDLVVPIPGHCLLFTFLTLIVHAYAALTTLSSRVCSLSAKGHVLSHFKGILNNHKFSYLCYANKFSNKLSGCANVTLDFEASV